MANYSTEKEVFLHELQSFAAQLPNYISRKVEWNIRIFMSLFKRTYALRVDTKRITSKLVAHLLPHFQALGERLGYRVECAEERHVYPDLTFVSQTNPDIKFAVVLKTTNPRRGFPKFCYPFTMDPLGGYFLDHSSTTKTPYPYSAYTGHFYIGVVFFPAQLNQRSLMKHPKAQPTGPLPSNPDKLLCFAQEKWKIAADKPQQTVATAVESIQSIDDLFAGNGVFAKTSEELFNDYWQCYGKWLPRPQGRRIKVCDLSNYLECKQLPADWITPVTKKYTWEDTIRRRKPQDPPGA